MPAVRREFFHVQAELRRSCFAGLVTQRACRIREYSRTVSDLCGRFFLRAIAHINQFHLAADRRGRNRIHQVISSLYGLTVYAGNHVAALQSSLLCRTTRFDAFNHHSIRSAQGLQGDWIRARLLLEADADGSARDAALLNALAVNVNRSCCE